MISLFSSFPLFLLPLLFSPSPSSPFPPPPPFFSLFFSSLFFYAFSSSFSFTSPPFLVFLVFPPLPSPPLFPPPPPLFFLSLLVPQGIRCIMFSILLTLPQQSAMKVKNSPSRFYLLRKLIFFPGQLLNLNIEPVILQAQSNGNCVCIYVKQTKQKIMLNTRASHPSAMYMNS